MGKRDTFSGFHPLVNFLYFGLALVFSMCFMHPLCLSISLVAAASYSLYLLGRKALRFILIFILPMALLAAAANPAFNHQGATILAYLPSGNPLTLESIAYGVGAALMLAGVILWFSCFNQVLTTDKFVYLLGRFIPALSLVLSMTLRFVPKFKAQIQVVAQAQAGLGRGLTERGLLRRLKNAITILSIMVTWSLENAIETADSMKSRGYGLPGRTAFSIYRWDGRDSAALAWLIGCGAYIVWGWATGGLYFRYYPTLQGAEPTPLSISFFLAYLALCATPLLADIRADQVWRKEGARC